MTYLDHAASTPMRPEAVEAMLPFLTAHPGNPSGSHSVARAAKTALEAAREEVAALLGRTPREIVFTGSGTEADNLAVKGTQEAASVLVTTAFEHKGVLAPARRLRDSGATLYEVAVTRGGLVDLDALGSALDATPTFVSVMAVNNEIGTIQPLADVERLVRERAPQALLHTDAIQAAPWIDVGAVTGRCDLVSLSGHKFGGPKGVGVLVVREGVALRAEIDGGGQEWGVRSGTVNVAGVVGFVTAMRVTAQQRTREVERIAALRDRLADGLAAAIPGLFVNGDAAHKVAGNVNVGVPGIESEALLVVIDAEGVCAAAGSSCASGATEPSHVLAAIGRSRSEALASIRLSLGYASTGSDVDRALDVIPRAVARLRTSERVA